MKKEIKEEVKNNLNVVGYELNYNDIGGCYELVKDLNTAISCLYRVASYGKIEDHGALNMSILARELVEEIDLDVADVAYKLEFIRNIIMSEMLDWNKVQDGFKARADEEIEWVKSVIADVEFTDEELEVMSKAYKYGRNSRFADAASILYSKMDEKKKGWAAHFSSDYIILELASWILKERNSDK